MVAEGRRANTYEIAVDVSAKLCIGSFYVLELGAAGVNLPTYAGSFDLYSVVHLVSDVAALMLYSLICLSILLRQRAKAKAKGIRPRLEALTGTFAALSLPFLPSHDLGVGINMLSIALMVLGCGGAAYTMLHLRTSFSIMAEARSMVTTGPYAVVRHPLYIFEQLAVIGALLKYASWYGVALIAVQMFFQWRRMLNEESVLRKTFPGYALYMAKTPRIIPTIGKYPTAIPTA